MWLNVIYYKVNLKPKHPVVSMICVVATRACLAMCLHVSSTRDTCSIKLFAVLIFVDHFVGHITALVIIFAVCWLFNFELCGSLLWWHILPIQCPFLLTPHRKGFMVGIAGLQIISRLPQVKLSGQTYFSSDKSHFWPDKH